MMRVRSGRDGLIERHDKEREMKTARRIVMAAIAVAVLIVTPARAQTRDIVDTAVAAGQFKTLAAALTAAGLVDTLKGAGPFTVFAPTDEAFAKLPKGTVDDLLKPENRAKLTAILTYHVVPGKVTAADAMKVKEIGRASCREREWMWVG